MLSTERSLDDKRGMVISLSNERDLLTLLSSARIIVLGIFIQKQEEKHFFAGECTNI